MQDERICFKDSKNALHEILGNRAYNLLAMWHSQFSPSEQNFLCCLAGIFYAEMNLWVIDKDCSLEFIFSFCHFSFMFSQLLIWIEFDNVFYNNMWNSHGDLIVFIYLPNHFQKTPKVHIICQKWYFSWKPWEYFWLKSGL